MDNQFLRTELNKRGVNKLKAVYSKELPTAIDNHDIESSVDNNSENKKIVGSVAFVPSVASLIISGEVIKDLAL